MIKLDVRGEVCPYPQMKAMKVMKEVLTKGTNEVIEVYVGHPPSLETIPA